MSEEKKKEEIIEEPAINFLYGQLNYLRGVAQALDDAGKFIAPSYVIKSIDKCLPYLRDIQKNQDEQIKDAFILMSTLQRVFIAFHKSNPEVADQHLQIVEKMFAEFVSNVFGKDAKEKLLEIQEAQVFNHPLDGLEI